MIKQQYETKFGAIWNLISSRNYSMPLFYKGLYILYYFVTISVILELLFDKTYILLALISSFIIVINGRKYDDLEQQYTEYLPISLKSKAKYIYYTTYMSIFAGGVIVFVLDYLYSGVNIIEYIYAILTIIALSNLAVVQMVKTKKSLIYFFIFDILIKILFMNTVLENTGIVIYLNILCMLIEYYKCKYLGKSKLKFFIKVLLSLVITVLFMVIK